MSKEPKSPKGEKASVKYWKKWDRGMNGNALWFGVKKTYDRLVSLEAKIEALKNTIELVYDISNNHFLVIALKEAQSEYSELIKENNL